MRVVAVEEVAVELSIDKRKIHPYNNNMAIA